jgi:O-antigen/teichoic acid export membrane protein
LYQQLLDYFRYTFRFARFNVLAAGFPSLFVVLLVMAALTSVDLSLANLLTLQIAAYVLIAMPFLPAFLREIGLPPLYTRWRVLIADARTGFPLTLEFGLDFLLSFSDRYLISFFLGTANVGRYQPAYQLGSLITFFPKVADGVMLPVLTGMIESGRRPEAERLVAAFLRVFLLLALPFAAGASMLGPTIVALLTTPEIAGAGRWVAALVAPASVFYGVAMLAVQVAYVLGRTRIVVGTKLVGAAVIVILNLLLLPWLPTITVPAAAALVASVASCAYAVAALRSSQWRMRIELGAMCRVAASTAVMTAPLWLLGYRPAAVAVVGVASVALAIGLALPLYFATWAALGGFGTLGMLRPSRVVAMLRSKGPAGSG